ncbi:MAG: hypothetical protein VKO39_04235 [Cyanobacteriota bacterium]|nr:hypothetical protein [Cyanobacteriota bacterium]
MLSYQHDFNQKSSLTRQSHQRQKGKIVIKNSKTLNLFKTFQNCQLELLGGKYTHESPFSGSENHGISAFSLIITSFRKAFHENKMKRDQAFEAR